MFYVTTLLKCICFSVHEIVTQEHASSMSSLLLDIDHRFVRCDALKITFYEFCVLKLNCAKLFCAFVFFRNNFTELTGSPGIICSIIISLAEKKHVSPSDSFFSKKQVKID